MVQHVVPTTIIILVLLVLLRATYILPPIPPLGIKINRAPCNFTTTLSF